MSSRVEIPCWRCDRKDHPQCRETCERYDQWKINVKMYFSRPVRVGLVGDVRHKRTGGKHGARLCVEDR